MAVNDVTRADSSAIVRDRLARLQTAVGAGGKFFDPFVSARAQDDLGRAHERMELGADLTVAALVGGTGSGKSTLFNAITGLQFADAGDIRPTTDRAAACVFNADASDLLDYLGVESGRRTVHDAILSDEGIGLDGLVLLDLPDHDSVQAGHSLQVERLLPMVDLVIWILDPQKYADHILHHTYLAQLAARRESIVVVLNQTDRIEPEGVRLITEDLRSLLADDGLGDVPILTTSALTGAGVAEVRAMLQDAVRRPSVATMTAAAELDAIARRLRVSVGESEADVRSRERDDIIDRLAQAGGVDAVAQSVRNAGRSLTPTALVEPQRPSFGSVAALRDSWIGYISAGLPQRWQHAVREVESAERLRAETGSVLKVESVPQVSRTGAWTLIGVGLAIALLCGVLAALGVGGGLMGRGALAFSGIVTAVLLYVVARRGLRRRADALANEYSVRVRERLAAVVDAGLVVPAEKVLDKHRATREALESFDA